MKKTMIFTIASLITGLTFAGPDSTSVENDTLIPRDFQISFVTPMGTNGMDYNKIENKVSINIFAGHHGGLNGVEVAGFANSIRKDAQGIQIAGFANSVLGDVNGIQLSGFANYAGKVEGIQTAGFMNVSKDTVEGVQLSGFANYAHNKSEGGQVAGFMNAVYGNAEGFYGAGFANTVSGNVKGIQVGGFMNAAHKGIEGMQLAGFANYSMGKVEGIQLSGFINVAKTLKGAQVGFINYSDSIEDGIMVGFLSFARKGYHQLEVEGSESLYGNLSFKTGTNQFYNILSVGAKPTADNLFWSFGYGIGSQLYFNSKLGMNVDLTANHVNKDDGFTAQLNLLNKLKPSVFYQFHPHFTVYGGPSLNVLVSETNIYGEANQSVGLIENAFYDKNIEDVNVKVFLGFQAGLRF